MGEEALERGKVPARPIQSLFNKFKILRNDFLWSHAAGRQLPSYDPSDTRARLDALGVKRFAGPARDFRLENDGLGLTRAAGRLRFDAVCPSLGSDIHSNLARALGAAVTEDGRTKVDVHQRASVPGLHAAGDVVLGLDQISHAMGEAGVAATTLRNDLAGLTPLLS